MFKAHPATAIDHAEDGTVLMQTATGKYFELDEVGFSALTALLEESNWDDYGSRMSREYEVAQEVAITDGKDLAATLLRHRLIQEVS